LSSALLLATALNPILGYDRVAQITARALRELTSPREAAGALGLVSAENYDRVVDPCFMAGIIG
jgi:fumarate hydratase class II